MERVATVARDVRCEMLIRLKLLARAVTIFFFFFRRIWFRIKLSGGEDGGGKTGVGDVPCSLWVEWVRVVGILAWVAGAVDWFGMDGVGRVFGFVSE